MKSIRTTIKWFFLIALIAGAITASYAYHLWTNKNQLLRTQILQRFAEIAPEWELELGECHFDLISRIYLKDLSFKTRTQATPLTVVPECVVTVNRDIFDLVLNHRDVTIQKVRLVRPQLKLGQAADGRWNWQDLPRIEPAGKRLPEFEIVEGTIAVHLERTSVRPAIDFQFRDVDCKLVPAANRNLVFEGVTHVDTIGRVQLQGRLDLDGQTGTLQGEMPSVSIGDELVEFIGKLAPQSSVVLDRFRVQISERLASLRRPGISQLTSDQARPRTAVGIDTPQAANATWSHSPGTPPSQFGPAAQSGQVPVTNPRLKHQADAGKSTYGGSALGVSADAKVSFRISRWQTAAVPEFKIWIDLLGGTVQNSVLPFTLSELTGKLYYDNRQCEVRALTGTNGPTKVELNARVYNRRTQVPGRCDLKVTNLAFDSRLRGQLTGGVARVYDLIRPVGFVDVEVSFADSGNVQWKPDGFLMTAKDCACSHVLFPYPVDNINGTVTQRGGDLEVSMQGSMAGRPAQLTGYIQNPGPAAASLLDVRVTRLPLDEVFLTACSPQIRSVIRDLRLTGQADAYLRLTRPAGLNQKFLPQLVAHLHDCSLNYRHFAYPIDNLTGTVKLAGGNWTFTELRGTHGKARLNGGGKFTSLGDVGGLQLTVTAEDAPLDESLRLAVSPTLKEVWAHFAPQGTLNLTTVIRWIQGQEPVVEVPEAQLTDGRIFMKTFPFPIGRVRADLAYAADTLLMKSVSGYHADTPIQVKGYCKIAPNGDWRARLTEFVVENLKPDPVFLRALPADVRAVFDCLDSRQRISMMGMLEFAGTSSPDFPVTAAWDVDTRFYGGTVAAGLDYKDLVGVVKARGTWDGVKAVTVGTIDLAQMTVLDHRLKNIRGPFHVSGNVLTLGSWDVLSQRRRGENRPAIDSSQRVSAEAIDGVIFLDALATLTDDPTYRVKMELSHGMLETYAREYLPQQQNLSGVMNGWVDLQGRGSSTDTIVGRGQLQVLPAALYELPVVVQVFNALRLGPPDTTAFKYALLDFNIANSRYQFNIIDLIGDSVSLQGRGGTVGFDGALSIDLFSRLPRTQLPSIPFVQVVIGQVTTGWVGIEVRGDLNHPVAKLKPAPMLNDALNQLFNGRPQFNLPPAIAPPLPAQPRRR